MEKPIKIIFVFYDVVYYGVAPRSAVAAQLTTEVAVWNGTRGGVTHSRIEEHHKVHHQEILHNVGFCKSGLLCFFFTYRLFFCCCFFKIDALRILKCK